MSSQNHYTNICKTLWLIKLRRPDDVVLVRACVYIASSRTSSTICLKFIVDLCCGGFSSDIDLFDSHVADTRTYEVVISF